MNTNKISQRLYYKTIEEIEAGKRSKKLSTQRVTDNINESQYRCEGFFSTAEEDGAGFIILSLANKVNIIENDVVSELTPQQCFRVLAIIDSMVKGIDPLTIIPDASERELAIASVEAAGIKLAVIEGRYESDVKAPYKLTPSPDGTVSVSSYD